MLSIFRMCSENIKQIFIYTIMEHFRNQGNEIMLYVYAVAYE